MQRVSSASLLWFGASGVVSLVLAQVTYYALLKDQQVARTFPLLFGAAPVVSILLGVLVLGEKLALKQVLGTALVIAGSLLLL